MRFTNFTKQAEIIKTRLYKINDSVKGIVSKGIANLNEHNKNKLGVYLDENNEKYNSFVTILNELLAEELPEDYDQKVVLDLEDEISEANISTSSYVKTILPPTKTEVHVPARTFENIQERKVRLPEFQLPTFSGKPNEWITFYNLYEASIQKNEQLNAVQKFQYLLSLVTQEPLNLIKGLPLTDANYQIAYDTLVARYNNPRVLVTYYLNNILDLPNLIYGSAKGFRNFIDVFKENSQALKALGHNIGEELTLITVLLKKLDLKTRKAFEDTRPTDHSYPKLTDLVTFLENECTHLEEASFSLSQPFNISRPNTSHTYTSPQKPSFRSPKTVLLTSNSVCNFCDSSSHLIYGCDKFKELTFENRKDFVTKNKLCYNCLAKHAFSACVSRRVCFHCKRKHHSLLHRPQVGLTTDNPPQGSQSKEVKPNKISRPTTSLTNQQSSPELPGNSTYNENITCHTTLSGFSKSHSTTVLLGTCLLKIQTRQGVCQIVRAVVDSGSEISLITEKVVSMISAKRCRADAQINGLSSAVVKVKGLTHLDILNLNDTVLAESHPLLILEKISSDLPRAAVSTEVRTKLQGLQLADSKFDIPGCIDMLIGADLFPYLLTGEQYVYGKNLPSALGTKLGFVIVGNCPSIFNESMTPKVSLLSTQHDDLHQLVQKFWTLDEIPDKNPKSEEDVFCENFYTETVSRTAEGRYVVRLPFNGNRPTEILGDSFNKAKYCFLSLENRLEKNLEMKTLYVDFMEDYKTSDHMEKCSESFTSEAISNPNKFYVLPHHGVLKDSTTTKLRVVFNASSKTSTNVSINDLLFCGPKLQTNVCDVITLFRRHNIVFTCDIKKMYRQILIHDQDQNYQLILWRNKREDPLLCYKLKTLTYGFKPAPFLAIRTLQQLVKDEGEPFPLASEVLKSQIFMDDIVTGASSLDSALKVKDQLIEVLSLGGFSLRKWTSNCTDLLQTVEKDHQEKPLFFREEDQPLFSVLGLRWIPQDDVFSYQITTPSCSNTKRSVLQTLAKVYDPCGFLAPVVFWAKSFFQCLWTLSLNWDDKIPSDLYFRWCLYVKELSLLGEIKIQRSFNLNSSSIVSLCGFCDASELGFAAQVYLRSETNSKVTVSLLVAKTKVAPLKKVSLPRLELCAAHLLAKLLNYCSSLLSPFLEVQSMFAWSDSTITLQWIQTPPYKLKVFVGNRVAEIQELIPTSVWSHVSSKNNPADIASRGLLPSEFLQSKIWFQGPLWLSDLPNEWPHSPVMLKDFSQLPEMKLSVTNTLITTSTSPWELLVKFSSWSKLQHVTAYMLRFLHNSKGKNKLKGPLSVQELNLATTKICKVIQNQTFLEDIERLQHDQPCSSRLARLAPFLDSDGVLRVGGRIRRAKLPFDAKHPILLPKTHAVVTLIITCYHERYLHAGPQLLQSILAKQFWIFSARSIIRTCIFKCIKCFRCKPTTTFPLMGDLPSHRVTPQRPFHSTGTDVCGPFPIKAHILKRSQEIKAYICIFICFATKACHLEVITDLSADTFIAALSRFTSRRGLSHSIFSDCGSNYIGSDTQLKKVVNQFFKDPSNQTLIANYCLNNSINFNFNPPAAPHQGGLWERAVRSIKHHLRRVVGKTVLHLEEFITLSVKIEAMLNSRPLVPCSSDPNEIDALTPGHFLIGGPLTSLPELNFDDIALNRLKRWQLVQALTQRIWRRWSTEYLHTLQQRLKWDKSSRNLREGQLVLLQEPNTPSLFWPLARITKVIPGADGVVRVVHLRTSTGTFTRPAMKVFLLPQD